MVYIVIYGLFILACFPARLRIRTAEYRWLDKSATDWLRGIAVLIVLIHHAVQKSGSFLFLYPFSVLGFGSVAVFFVLSGYGLGMQYKNKANYLRGFIPGKVSRMYIVFWIAYVLTSIGYLFQPNGCDIALIIHNCLTLSIVHTPTWYIKVQAFLYILFYLVYISRFTFRFKLVLVYLLCTVYAGVCIWLGVQQYWYFTILWFPIGLTIAFYKEQIEKVFKKGALLITVLSGAAMCVVTLIIFFMGYMGHPVLMEGTITAAFVLFLLGLSYQIRFTSRWIIEIGKRSLELYLVHSMLLSMYPAYWTMDSLSQYIVFLGVSIAVAIIVRVLSYRVIRIIKGKKSTIAIGECNK